jgi:hypothetical protein
MYGRVIEAEETVDDLNILWSHVGDGKSRSRFRTRHSVHCLSCYTLRRGTSLLEFGSREVK